MPNAVLVQSHGFSAHATILQGSCMHVPFWGLLPGLIGGRHTASVALNSKP